MAGESVKVRVPTPDGPFGAENLWVTRGVGLTGVVDNTPFFTDELALGDTIAYDSAGEFVGRISRGPNETWRALIDGDEAAHGALVAELRELIGGNQDDISVETGFGILLALSAPATRHAALRRAFAAATERGLIGEWEEPGESLAA